MMKRSKIWALMLSSILSLSACGVEVDCDIEDEHIHYYKTRSGIERLIDGEKEYVGEYIRCDEYVLKDDYYNAIASNHLCILNDSLEYVERRFENRPESTRLELVKEYVPEHYGMQYKSGGNDDTGSIYWGVIPEAYDERWEEIGVDDFTDNLVKDVTYGLLLYRINEDGSIESKAFVDLESREEGYDYFQTGTLITKIMGDEYYLDSNKKKVNVNK